MATGSPLRSSSKRVVPDTPAIVRHTSGAAYRTGELGGARSAVLDDLGRWIPEVPISFMLDYIMPPVKFDVEDVKLDLKRKKLISGSRWKLFPKNPADTSAVENKTFTPLADLFSQISTSVDPSRNYTGEEEGGGEGKGNREGNVNGEERGRGRGKGRRKGGGKGKGKMKPTGSGTANATSQVSPHVHFVNNPDRAPYSERSNDTRPDSYFVRKSTYRGRTLPRHSTKSKAPLHHWYDIPLSSEHKKLETAADIRDNTRKVLWSMQHIMRCDPCRRFTFGITVENTQMRIWFCCRSAVCVTESFNFILDHDTLIHVVLSFTFATNTELGWDPTVERIWSDIGQLQYKITVHERKDGGNGVERTTVESVYLTTKILSDFGADALRGRGTRVFEARLLDDKGDAIGDPVAIKDVWVDEDRQREGTIRENLYQTASSEDKVLVEKHFFTVLRHGDVVIDGRVDHIRDLIMRGQDVPMDHRFLLPRETPDMRPGLVSSVGVPQSWDECARTRAPPGTRRQHHAKVHYRVVFKEVGKPIYALRKLDLAFQILVDTITGLKLLHKYDYVHRDVSSGNVMEWQQSGKLGDLEYVKKCDDSSSHEIRTGTLDFMSIEVESQKYNFRPRHLKTTLEFHYNPLHDLESVWWLAVWFIFCHVVEGTQWVTDSSRAKEQLRLVQLLFPRHLGARSRLEQFEAAAEFALGFSSLPPSFLDAAKTLEDTRSALVDRYELAESGDAIDESAFVGIHETLIQSFHDAKDSSRDVVLQPLISLFTELHKHERQEETAEGPKRKKRRT